MKLFLSHSSLDKLFVKKLHSDLTSNGYKCWLDEFSIQVGDCIVSKIEEGLSESDYIIVVVSKNSSNSEWVNREWKTKYWNEVQEKKIQVLPVVIEDCPIPELLKTKKYADFKTDYDSGLNQLITALANKTIVLNKTNESNSSVPKLLERLLAREQKLSVIILDIFLLSSNTKDQDLLDFGLSELKGYQSRKQDETTRSISGFFSWNAIQQVNLLPGQTIDSFWKELERNQEFFPLKFNIGYSISELESSIDQYQGNHSQSYITLPSDTNHILGQKKANPTKLYIYLQGDTYKNIYEKIRLKAIKLLTDRLHQN